MPVFSVLRINLIIFFPLLFYPLGLIRDLQWTLGAGVLLFNAALYGLVLLRRLRRSRRTD